MSGLDHHRHPQRIERLLNAVADLDGQSFLHLETARISFHNPGDFRESGNIAVRNVCDVRLPVKRKHVVFAKRIQLNILDDHHLFVLFVKFGRQQDFARIFIVTARQETHRLGDPFGRLDQPFAVGILAQQFEDRSVMFGKFLDGFGIVHLFSGVILFHDPLFYAEQR